MKGWHDESVRHSLAARGMKTNPSEWRYIYTKESFDDIRKSVQAFVDYWHSEFESNIAKGKLEADRNFFWWVAPRFLDDESMNQMLRAEYIFRTPEKRRWMRDAILIEMVSKGYATNDEAMELKEMYGW